MCRIYFKYTSLPVYVFPSGYHVGPFPRRHAPETRLQHFAGRRQGKLRHHEPASYRLLHREDPASVRDDDREARIHAGGRTLRGQDLFLPRALGGPSRRLRKGRVAAELEKTYSHSVH